MRIWFALLCLTCSLAYGQISLASKGSISTGGNAQAEIAAFDPVTRRLFSINVTQNRLDVLEVSAGGTLSPAFNIPVGGIPNSVVVKDGLVAAAVQNDPKTNPGWVKFYDTAGQFLKQVTVGALPDMLLFTPNGRKILVANEGEPNSYNQPDSVDPEGSVSIIDLSGGIASLDQSRVTTAGFASFIPKSNQASIRVYGPNATFAQDMEPEYIAVSADSRTAWVTLQENNAIAVLNIEAGRFTGITGLGFKLHAQAPNKLDPSDRDGGIHIMNWPVAGLYEPDAIDTYRARGETFLVMANEGDTRDYTGFNEETRVGTLNLDAAAFPDATTLKAEANLGRLTVTRVNGDVDGDGDYDRLLLPGARSFSIRRTNGDLVWDSGSQFEDFTASLVPMSFNSNGAADTFDTRSDNKGPEPEGLTIGRAWGREYAFIGLERTGGVMVYDISSPEAPRFVQYVNTAPANISPEGLLFIAAEESPTGKPLLVVSYEITGTIEVFEISRS